MRAPRILPLVGVAIVGVAAANALAGAHALPDLFSATRAAAEEALRPAKAGKAAKGASDASAAPASATDAGAKSGPLPAGAGPQSAAKPPPAICAPSPSDLARAAGLSPSELQVLQNLQTRRGQIDTREKDLDTEVQLLAAAETKLDAKLRAMNTLKGDIQALMGQADQKSQAEIANLVTVYSKMKPTDAAAVMAQLDDKVRLPIAEAMKASVLSAILDKMGTADAKILTEKLARRFAPIQSIADAANAPVPAASPQGSPAPQAAAAAGDEAGVTAPAAEGAKPGRKKTPLRRLAARRRPRSPAEGAAKGVTAPAQAAAPKSPVAAAAPPAQAGPKAT
jgi:flagellar motility protein MotE (MotC chaperone)